MNPLKRRFVAGSTEAVATKRQHRKPCADCPFARASIPGWLGSTTAAQWITDVHGEAFVDCHCTTNQQCAGAAIYRANVCKEPRDKRNLQLPPDTTLCFATPQEFLAHHAQGSRAGNLLDRYGNQREMLLDHEDSAKQYSP